MAQAFNHIKSNKKWEVEYMNLYLRDKENDQRGFQRGLQQGVQQERLRAAKSLVGILPIKVISEKFDIPIEQLTEETDETKQH
ncbi:hypothetical protein [Eubacterium aggregans]|uniref:hypothetical protein n=1 Tax=Eubacterium aggregans TaxID=81409 RepID=UPI003F67D5FF